MDIITRQIEDTITSEDGFGFLSYDATEGPSGAFLFNQNYWITKLDIQKKEFTKIVEIEPFDDEYVNKLFFNTIDKRIIILKRKTITR